MERSDAVDLEGLERALGRFMARHLGPGLIPDADMFTDMFRLVSQHGIAVPNEVAAVFRALATLEGSLTHLAPGFNVVEEAKGLITAEATDQFEPTSLRHTVTAETMSLLPMIRRFPRRIDRITADLERGRFKVGVQLFSGKNDERIIAGLLRQSILAMLAATSGIIGALLLLGNGGPLVSDTIGLNDVLGYGFLLFGVILTLNVMFGDLRRRRRR